jgi:predicted glycoside hydrolase/deacetylase ChbG (UPF0249 family)
VKRLIVNADDFGLCSGVNSGILRAHKEGIVTSTTLMVNMGGAGQAYAIAKATPSLGVGIHINLTGGKPVSEGVESLLGPDGSFLKLPALAECARRDHLEREIGAQIAAFQAAGLAPTHIDSHHHVHRLIPAVGDIVSRLAGELGLPVRAISAGFAEGFYSRVRVTVDWLLDFLSDLPDGETDMMCHPACMDAVLPQVSSYSQERLIELETLTDSRVKAAIAANQIELITYRDLKGC